MTHIWKALDKIVDLMKLCEIFAFRVYYMAGWRSYSGKDRLYTVTWTERFSRTEHENNIGKLRNLTLTTQSENSKLSNFNFDIKKEIYKDSVWHINKELKNYLEWTEKQIDEHEKEIVNFAKIRWGFERENLAK